MRNSPFLVGIDVGSGAIRIVVLDAHQETPRIVYVGQIATESVYRGYIKDIGKTSALLKRLVARAEKNINAKIRDVHVAFGAISLSSHIASGTIVIGRADGEVNESDVDRAISKAEDVLLNDTKNRKIIHTFPLEYKLDGKQVFGNPIGLSGVKLEARVMLVSAYEHHIDTLARTLDKAGLRDRKSTRLNSSHYS